MGKAYSTRQLCLDSGCSNCISDGNKWICKKQESSSQDSENWMSIGMFIFIIFIVVIVGFFVYKKIKEKKKKSKEDSDSEESEEDLTPEEADEKIRKFTEEREARRKAEKEEREARRKAEEEAMRKAEETGEYYEFDF